MFQDSLLIIKSDYMAKRKTLLIYLLRQGFQIQGQRKLRFTPELAAEFYQDISNDPDFMFQVILLSQGPSEAFILAKECAVEELINCLVCYFGNSVEMQKNVHATRCLGKVRKEICFIFPNYIFEPINSAEQVNVSCSNPFVSSLISELYDIVTKPDRDPHIDWKRKLADFLIRSNKDLPEVSNQCSYNPDFNMREVAQQTKLTCFKHGRGGDQTQMEFNSSDMGFDTDGTSLNLTTSSCVTCSEFGSGDAFVQQQQPFIDIIKAKTAPLAVSTSSSSSENVAGILIKDEGMTEEIDGEGDEAVEPNIPKNYEAVEAPPIARMSGDNTEETRDALFGFRTSDNSDKAEAGEFEASGAGDASAATQSEERATTEVGYDNDLQQDKQIDLSQEKENQADYGHLPESEPALLPVPDEISTNVDADPESNLQEVQQEPDEPASLSVQDEISTNVDAEPESNIQEFQQEPEGVDE